MWFFPTFDVLPHVAQLRQYGVTSLPTFLDEHLRTRMLSELESYTFTRREREKGPRRVQQRFSVVESFPDESIFWEYARDLSAFLSGVFAREVGDPFVFNELVVQRYEPGPLGISPHRDGPMFKKLIVVLVLEGSARFCVCDDNEGSNPREVPNEPGALVLVRGPGFLGENTQPIHFVDQISTPRTTFAMRYRVEQ